MTLWSFTRRVVPRVLLVAGLGSCISGTVLSSDVLLFVSLVSLVAFMAAAILVDWEVMS